MSVYTVELAAKNEFANAQSSKDEPQRDNFRIFPSYFCLSSIIRRDGRSMQVLAREIQANYPEANNEPAFPLPGQSLPV